MTSDAVNMLPICVPVSCEKYSESGSFDFVFKNVIGRSIAFQFSSRFKIRHARIPERPTGIPIYQKQENAPAPSTFADSKRASGISLKNL